MADVERRVALVTGANRGMGYETVRQLARLGMRVILSGRDPSRVRRAAAELEAEGESVDWAVMDVTAAAQVKTAVDAAVQRYGRIDVLVNNAGALLESGTASVWQADPATLMRIYDINVLGALRVSQAVVPVMRRNDYGRIVNVSSGMGQLAEMNGHWPGYRMSKTALNALTRILADELGPGNIKVNAVCPGWVRTAMGGPGAERTVEEGVATTVWLACLPDDGPSGGFFRDRAPIPW